MSLTSDRAWWNGHEGCHKLVWVIKPSNITYLSNILTTMDSAHFLTFQYSCLLLSSSSWRSTLSCMTSSRCLCMASRWLTCGSLRLMTAWRICIQPGMVFSLSRDNGRWYYKHTKNINDTLNMLTTSMRAYSIFSITLCSCSEGVEMSLSRLAACCCISGRNTDIAFK